MTDDLLERLAELPAPQTPPYLGREVHRRVNERLVGLHAGELLAQAAPLAAVHLFEALRAAAHLTLTGHWPTDRARHYDNDKLS